MTAPAFRRAMPATAPVSRTCETGLGRWAERWRSSRISGAGPASWERCRIRPVELAPPIDSLLRRATDALTDCFAIYRAVTDERGNVVDFAVEHMNDAARRDLGVGADEPVGQTIGRLQPDYLRSQAFRWLRHIIELEVPGGREDNAYEPLAGDRRRLLQSTEMRAAPLGDGRVVVVWRDVTEHARVDENLRLESNVLRHAAEGVCLVRASDGVIVYANHRFAEIMGYEDGELDGSPCRPQLGGRARPGGAPHPPDRR